MERNYKVVYITSPMHSGSTLLDYLLGAHSRAVSLGEVVKIADYANLRHKAPRREFSNNCACGAPTIWDCSFWIKVDHCLRRISQGTLDLRTINLRADSDTAFTTHNELLFDAIAEATDANLLIDSSKGIQRLNRLLKITDLEIAIVALHRDPHGQINSVLKRPPHLRGRPASRPYSRFWSDYQQLLQGHPKHLVKYENLASALPSELSRLMTEMGFSMEPSQMQFREASHHNIAGNRMRFTTADQVRLDNEWKHTLTFMQKAWISYRVMSRAFALLT